MSSDATAAKLAELIGVCRRCDGPLIGHQFARFASIIAGQREIPSLKEFFDLSERHNWEGLVKFQEWDGSRDVVQAFVIKCSHNELQLVVLKDVFEPLAANQLYSYVAIEPKESAVIQALIPSENWQNF